MKTLQKVIDLMNTNDTLTQEIERLKAVIAQQEQELKEFREIQRVLGINTEDTIPFVEDLFITETETDIEAPSTSYATAIEEDSTTIEPFINPFSDEALEALEEPTNPFNEELTTPFDEELSTPFDEDTTIDDIFPPLEPQEVEETGEPKTLDELIALLKEDLEKEKEKKKEAEEEEIKEEEVKTAPEMLKEAVQQNKEGTEEAQTDYTINPKDIFIGRVIPTVKDVEKKAQLISEVLNRELKEINENNLTVSVPQMQEIKKEYSKLSKLLNRSTLNRLKSKLNISKTFTIDSIPNRVIALETLKELNYILEFGELADSLTEVKIEEKDPKVQPQEDNDLSPLSQQLIGYLLNTQIEPTEAFKKEIYTINEKVLVTMFKEMFKNDVQSILESQRNSLIENKAMHDIYMKYGERGENVLRVEWGLKFLSGQICDIMEFGEEIRKIVEDI